MMKVWLNAACRVGAALACLSGLGSVALAQQTGLSCPAVQAVQGGVAVCRTVPGVAVSLDGSVAATAGPDGWAVIGLPRDTGPSVTITADAAGAEPIVFDVAAQDYPISRIDNVRRAGSSYNEVELAHICMASHLKRAAFEAPSVGSFFLDGFILPSEGRRSGVYGSQRIYNGREDRPGTHWGIDIAAPVGTPIVAPAGGVVTLADPNLFFEGGTVFLDHGQGLVSVFMHMSKVSVTPGMIVEQGELLGDIGSTGRSTGPHLHWGVKYNDRYWIDPALLVALNDDAFGAGDVRHNAYVIEESPQTLAFNAYAGALAACFEP